MTQNTPNNSDLTPLLDPILALLRSRKFVIAVVTALVDTLIIAVPSLLPVRDQLLEVLTALGLALIGTTAAEDVSRQHAEAKVKMAEHAANAVVMAAKVSSTPPVISSPEREPQTGGV